MTQKFKKIIVTIKGGNSPEDDIEAYDPEEVDAYVSQSGEELLSLRREIRLIKELVNSQAEDEGLWFDAKYISEAHLQQELRRLHALIETGYWYYVDDVDPIISNLESDIETRGKINDSLCNTITKLREEIKELEGRLAFFERECNKPSLHLMHACQSHVVELERLLIVAEARIKQVEKTAYELGKTDGYFERAMQIENGISIRDVHVQTNKEIEENNARIADLEKTVEKYYKELIEKEDRIKELFHEGTNEYLELKRKEALYDEYINEEKYLDNLKYVSLDDKYKEGE